MDKQPVTLTKLKKKVIIYVRKSRLRNDDVMEIERQIQLCVDYAQANNLEYEIISEEGSSEDWEGRPELQRMLRRLESNIFDGVLVTDQDRIARDSVDFGLFKRFCKNQGLALFTLNKTYNFYNDDDDFITDIQSSMDNQFMRITKRKLMRGRIQALEKGIYFGIPPYGYTKEKAVKRDKKLIPHPVESKVVETIFDLMVNKKKNAVEIAEIITLMGFKTRENKDFNNRAIYYIISNVVYTGKLEYKMKNINLIEVENAHKAIISQDLFNKAQALRLERRIVPQNLTRGKYILSKLIKCGNCGTTLSFCHKYTDKESSRARDKSKRVPYVLSCYASLSGIRKAKFTKENRCKCVGIKASRIEEIVFQDLRSRLTELDDEISILLDEGNEFFDDINRKVEDYNIRLEQLKEERVKVQNGWSKGIFDEDEALEKIQEIKEQRLMVESKKKEIEKVDVSVEVNRKNEMKEIILDLLSSDNTDTEKTNNLLREVIQSVRYYKEEPDNHAGNYYPEPNIAIIYK